ncbi:Uncharacterised protein [Streptococcus pneumoniae]|nr:Uncharacterised protein [Streptococcus pneumoniae]
MSLSFTSSKLLRPRFRTFIISASDFSVKSCTVLIPARFKQLYERTDKSSSSIVRSKIRSSDSVSASFITSVDLAISVRFVNKSRCSVKIRAESPKASSGIIVPFVKISRVNLSKPSLLPTRAGST